MKLINLVILVNLYINCFNVFFVVVINKYVGFIHFDCF